MRQIAVAILGICVIASLALFSGTAKAGDYYNGGYSGYSGYYNGGYRYSGYRSGYSGYRSGTVSYSSSCCYRKVVRHVRSVRYVRTDDGYRNGYYGQPYRNTGYYGRPYRYSNGGYYNGGYGGGYYNNGYNGGYGVYRAGYNGGYASNCTTRRVRIGDGYGGWYWTTTRSCY